MKIGVVSSGILQFEFEEGLDFLERHGFDAIELGCGGFHANLKYCDPERLLADRSEFDRWLEAIRSRDLEVSALAIHGEALSPDPEVARRYERELRNACALAQQIGIDRLTLLAGLPEGAPGDTAPCFVAGAWPEFNQEIYRYQWEERVIPYWVEHGQIAQDHGVRLCFEMHPYDMVYNPRSLLKLRNAVGDVIGCNFDPSHMFWQGIDPIEAMRALGPTIYHVHAKDTQLDPRNVRVNGLLDPTPFDDIENRAWSFRTVGWAHDDLFWREFISTLRVIGYDDVLSIEHEDVFMDLQEGLEKAFEFLSPLVLRRPRGVSYWDLNKADATPV